MKFIDKLLSHTSSLFRNGGPDWSSTRFAFMLSVVISNIVVFGVWVGLSIAAGVLLPIDSSIIVLYCIANGISSATKLIQKQQEKVTKKN
jgi:hypothetical protein